MIKTRSADPPTLDAARFDATSSHQLALVLHRETEAARKAQAAQLVIEHGEFMPVQNLLMIKRRPAEWCADIHWTEYLTDEVLGRCAAALTVSKGVILERIVSEFRPENWEVLFWRGAWYGELEDSTLEIIDLEFRLKGQAQKLEAQRRAIAKAGGHASHESQYGKAKAFVRAEWKEQRELYGGNKSAFARIYVDRARKEYDTVVTNKTIASVWLKGH